jgi:hypothetical protein
MLVWIHEERVFPFVIPVNERSTIMVVTISLHFAPYSMDLRFFCLALKGAGRRPQHAENWTQRKCSSQTAKPREEPCTCFSNYQLGSFEGISKDCACNSGIALFLHECQRFLQLPNIIINFTFVVIFIHLSSIYYLLLWHYLCPRDRNSVELRMG